MFTGIMYSDGSSRILNIDQITRIEPCNNNYNMYLSDGSTCELTPESYAMLEPLLKVVYFKKDVTYTIVKADDVSEAAG